MAMKWTDRKTDRRIISISILFSFSCFSLFRFSTGSVRAPKQPTTTPVVTGEAHIYYYLVLLHDFFYFPVASAPNYAFAEFLLSELCKLFFWSRWMLSHISVIGKHFSSVRNVFFSNDNHQPSERNRPRLGVFYTFLSKHSYENMM